MRKRMMVLPWLIILTLTAGACAPVTESTLDDSGAAAAAESVVEADGALQPVALGVGFIPSVQFAPFYVGIAQGFYAEEGLDLSLDYGFENDYLKLVGVNDSRFMVGSGDQVILGRAQGLPVRYVMKWYSDYPVALFAKPAAGITQPADMAGKTIGIPGPFGASYVAFRALLEAGGLSESDVDLVSIGFTQAAAVSEDAVDAALDYAVNGPVVLALDNIPTTQLSMRDYLNMPSNGLVTNEVTLAEEPELVAAMVRATLRAVDHTLANPDEAFAVALQFVPEAGGDNEAANRAIFDASLPFWTPAPDQIPGASNLTDWEYAAEFMQRIGLVDVRVPAEELFTNEFLP